ncbi:MAG: LptF/LptG family permease [Spirochaetales bacterium]|nr:LptF/LptG family permease [Spirochaetales bacterium]
MSYKRISLYLGFEFFISFGVAFLFFFFVFFINQILLLIEEILSKNIPFHIVGKLVIYALPRIFSFTFPFSTVVGALMACGRFIAHNEFLAMQACGISYKRIFIPFIILAGIFTLVSFSINDYFIPWGTVNTYRLKAQMLQENPELDLEPYSKKKIEDSTIITGNIENKIIYDIVILDKENGTDKRVISAKEARITTNPDQDDVISLKLNNVFSQTVEKAQKSEFSYFSSDEMVYNILLKDMSINTETITASEKRTLDILKNIREKKKALKIRLETKQKNLAVKTAELKSIYLHMPEISNCKKELGTEELTRLRSSLNDYTNEYNTAIFDRSLHTHLLEFNNKFALPFGCIAFVLLAFPVSLFSKRSGRSVGFLIGVIFTVIYWGLVFMGYRLGRRAYFNPALAMWIPNLVLLVFSGIFFALRFKK